MSLKPLAAFLTASLLAAAASAADAPKPDPAKGAEAFANNGCLACHGPEAGGVAELPTQPRLAHQFPEYVAKQLTEFKSGARDNPIMKPMADLLSDSDIQNVAAWVSQQKVSLGAAPDPASVALGERIYRGGIADRRIPACAACHGPDGGGIPSQYPHLAGQFPEYVTAQITGFRDGTRNNNSVMTDVAAKMNDREIKAVADYIAGLR